MGKEKGKVAFIGLLVVWCLFVTAGAGILIAKTVEEADAVMTDDSGIDTPVDMENVLVEFESGEIESFSDGIIRMHGIDYFVSGDEPCQDMAGNAIDINELVEGDMITINFVARDMFVTMVQLDSRKNDNENLDDESPVRKTSSGGGKIIQLQDGSYTN